MRPHTTEFPGITTKKTVIPQNTDSYLSGVYWISMSKDEEIQMAVVALDRNFFNTIEGKFILGND